MIIFKVYIADQIDRYGTYNLLQAVHSILFLATCVTVAGQ